MADTGTASRSDRPATPNQLWVLNRAGRLGLLVDAEAARATPVSAAQADQAIKASIAQQEVGGSNGE